LPRINLKIFYRNQCNSAYRLSAEGINWLRNYIFWAFSKVLMLFPRTLGKLLNRLKKRKIFWLPHCVCSFVFCIALYLTIYLFIWLTLSFHPTSFSISSLWPPHLHGICTGKPFYYTTFILWTVYYITIKLTLFIQSNKIY